MEKLSASRFAKKLNVDTYELLNALKAASWIKKNEGDEWELTDNGKNNGGVAVPAKGKLPKYIAWPEALEPEIKIILEKNAVALATVTKMAEKVNVPAQKLNLIFSELGWIEKDIRGWVATKLGKQAGGRQRERAESGSLFVLWPESILENAVFKEALSGSGQPEEKSSGYEINFRNKFPAHFRTQDGHFVRSRAEVIIDDYLYHNQVIHAYERKVGIEEELYCDFYIPVGKKVYIEYWGKEGDEKYEARKARKIELYRKNELNLIELTDADINSLDDTLPGKLLKYEIKGY